jgi:hypothetical protein
MNSQPSDSSLDSSGGEPEIIEVSSDSEIDDFMEFEHKLEVEPVIKNEGPGELESEDPEVDKPRKKLRIEGYNNDTSDASGNFEIMDLNEDFEDEEADLYEGEDPHFFVRDQGLNPTRISERAMCRIRNTEY